MKPPIIQYPSLHNYPVYKNCYFKTIQHGESKENVLDRLLPYYENDILSTLSENHTPLIVTHKHTARVLMKHVLKMSDEAFESYELPKQMMVIHLNKQLEHERTDLI